MNFMSVTSLRGSVIRLIAACLGLMALVSCGGGGGAPGLPSGTPSALFTTAPGDVTLTVGSPMEYVITGGRAPYTVNSTNKSIADASMASSNSFRITPLLAGKASILIKDTVGVSVTVAVTVASPALYSTAPSALTLVVGTAQSYIVSGGQAPYTVNSSNPTISVAGINANNVSIAAVSVGNATIGILDASGTTISVSVTVTDGSSATPLFTTATDTITVSSGGTRNYSIGGGLAPYTATSADTNIATVSVTGSTLSIVGGTSGGTTLVVVRDKANKTVSISVKVGSANPFFTTAPSSVTMLVGATQAYAISGGSGSYAASSSNVNIVQAAVAGSTLSLTAVAAGTANVSVLDSTGASLTIAVKVATSGTGVAVALYTTAPDAIIIPIASATVPASVYDIGGGTGPYTATSSTAGVATASVAGTKLTIAGVAVGATQVKVIDSAGALLLISVKVSASGTGVESALYTSAPGAVTIPIASIILPAPVYDIGGGTGPYNATSSIAGVATASVTGTKLTITGKAAGVAQVKVLDSAGASIIISVTVSASATGVVASLYTTAAASVTMAPGAAPVYGIGGGTGPYVATTSNTAVATAGITASPDGTSAAGLQITGVADGSAQIRVVDATGTAVSVNVTVSAGAVTALYTTAPTTISLPKLGSASYLIGGGKSPYTVATSNAAVATVSVSGTTLTIVGGATSGSAQIKIVDTLGASVTISVTVASEAPVALFTSAPNAITLAKGATAGAYTVGGGTGAYTVTSSNVGVATVTPFSPFTITGVAVGTANVVVTDTAGAAVSIAVTVSPTASTPLTVLPGNPTGAVGDVLTFSISGGSPGYTVTVNNLSIASVSPTTIAGSGGTFAATLRNVGSTAVVFVDLLGQSSIFTLTVTASAATLRLSPSAFAISEKSPDPVYLSIYGGSVTYTAFTSDLVVSAVSIVNGTTLLPDVNGTTLKVAVGGSTGNRCITPATALGTYNVTITVVDKLGASATSVMTIQDNGACP